MAEVIKTSLHFLCVLPSITYSLHLLAGMKWSRISSRTQTSINFLLIQEPEWCERALSPEEASASTREDGIPETEALSFGMALWTIENKELTVANDTFFEVPTTASKSYIRFLSSLLMIDTNRFWASMHSNERRRSLLQMGWRLW